MKKVAIAMCLVAVASLGACTTQKSSANAGAVGEKKDCCSAGGGGACTKDANKGSMGSVSEKKDCCQQKATTQTQH